MPETPSQIDPRALDKHDLDTVPFLRRLITTYHLTDLMPALEATSRLTKNAELNVAVFGRFKAGKSSFLNHLLGESVLPVGVVPVTSVVTEISYADQPSAQVVYQNGRPPENVSLGNIETYICESGNPENALGVERVRVFLPRMIAYRGLRLVDTPGLESSLLHNTETSLCWTPNTDLAIIAVGVDPPLTQHDLSLIERLQHFTPNVSLLLTKMDLLTPPEQDQVLEFVRQQLGKRSLDHVRVFPYSVKHGYEKFQQDGVRRWLNDFLAYSKEARSATFRQKISTLLTSSEAYLQLALKSAAAKEIDRESLRSAVLGDGRTVADLHAHIDLVAARAAAGTRPHIERHLNSKIRPGLCRVLTQRLTEEFPKWRSSFAVTLREFRRWLAGALNEELKTVAAREAHTFLEPLREEQRLSQSLIQSFRDRLSDEVQRAFGFALRTTETEIDLTPPNAPDISIGKVFNHEWGFLFAVIPTLVARGALERKLSERLEAEVHKNLSRLTTQWEDAACNAISASAKEAHRRIEELVSTIQRLLCTSESTRVDPIRDDLEQLQVEINRLARSGHS